MQLPPVSRPSRCASGLRPSLAPRLRLRARPARAGCACTQPSRLSRPARRPSRRSSASAVLRGGDGTAASRRRSSAAPGARARPEPTVPRRRDGATRRDPLAADEWWRSALGVDRPHAARARQPVTVVDSGLDLRTPSSRARRTRRASTRRSPRPRRRARNGVASLVGAPVNGVGHRRHLPASASLRSWDAALGRRDAARRRPRSSTRHRSRPPRRGRGVINLSLGGTERDLADRAGGRRGVRRGLARRRRLRQRRRPTAARSATRRRSRTCSRSARRTQPDASPSFSSRSPFVDLAAPGDDITVATASDRELARERPARASRADRLRRGGLGLDGAARARQRRQLFEVLRRSARDIEAPGSRPCERLRRCSTSPPRSRSPPRSATRWSRTTTSTRRPGRRSCPRPRRLTTPARRRDAYRRTARRARGSPRRLPDLAPARPHRVVVDARGRAERRPSSCPGVAGSAGSRRRTARTRLPGKTIRPRVRARPRPSDDVRSSSNAVPLRRPSTAGRPRGSSRRPTYRSPSRPRLARRSPPRARRARRARRPACARGPGRSQREARRPAVRDRSRERLEQLVGARLRDLAHEADDVAVVDGVLDASLARGRRSAARARRRRETADRHAAPRSSTPWQPCSSIPRSSTVTRSHPARPPLRA